MTSIKLKKSSVAGKIPVDSDLAHGELAINFQDGKIFYKDASNTIKAFIDSAAVDSLITTRQGLDSAGVKSVHFADNESLTFGNDSDLEIMHLGTYSRIRDKGTGNLVLAVDDLQVTNSAVTENILIAKEDGSVDLYYDNSKKFETTAYGATVTGKINADSAEFNGHISAKTATISQHNEDSGLYTTLIVGERPNNDGYASLQFNYGPNQFASKIDGTASTTGIWTNANSTSGERFQVNYGSANETVVLKPLAQTRLTADKYGAIITGRLTADSATINGDVTFDSAGAVLFDKSDQSLKFGDNKRIRLGASNDLQIYHDGTGSNIINTTGNLIIADTSGDVKIQGKYGEQSIVANNDGSVELYYDNTKKVETTSKGIAVTGRVSIPDGSQTQNNLVLGNDSDFFIYHSGQTVIANKNGSGPIKIQGKFGEQSIIANQDGSVELYYNASKKFETLDSGVNITGNLRVNNAPFTSGIDSNTVITIVDSDYVLSRSGATIEVLNDDSSLSYLQKLSFAPTLTDGVIEIQPKIGVLDSAGNESLLDISFVGGGGVDSASTQAMIDSNLANNITFGGDVTFDSANAVIFDKSEKQLRLGRGYQLVIHDSDGASSFMKLKTDTSGATHRIIADGGLVVQGDNVNIKNRFATEFMLKATQNGSVELYYDNVKKFETTDSGAEVTGLLKADSAALTGKLNINMGSSINPAIELLGDGPNTIRFFDGQNRSVTTNAVDIAYRTAFNDLRIERVTGQKIAEFGGDDGHAALYFNDTKRLETSDSGVSITGRLRADSATISGLSFPTADGTVNQAILTDGNGNLTFGTVATGAAGGVTGTFNQIKVNSFTGDSSTTAFTLSSAPASGSENSVVVTINGLVQHVNTYSLSGTTVTLDSAPETGDAIEMRVHDDYSANVNLRDYKSYVYTPSTNTTAFSGSDANGNTLAYDQGKVEVYLNGSRLVTGLDYTETSGTTVTLDSAIGSGDTLEIVSLSAAAIADFGVLPVDSDLTTTAADQIIHQFSRSDFRTVKYIVQLEHDSDNKYHSEEILLTHNNTTVAMTTYAQILLDSNLGSFDADISGANVRLKLTPTKTNTSVKLRAIRVGA